MERYKEVAADQAYDDRKLIRKLWDDWQALPIIDIRNFWKDVEASKVVPGCDNAIYDYLGTISCVCMKSGTQRQMVYGGYERNRMTLKYRCPGQHCGYECVSRDCCPVDKAIRIHLDEEQRVFTP